MILYRNVPLGLAVVIAFISTVSTAYCCPMLYHKEQVLASVNPERIISIADDGNQCTVVWFPPQHVITQESPEVLFAKFGNFSSAFARFTRPDMSRVWVKVTAITDVRAPTPGQFAPGVNAVLYMGADHQGIREDIQATNARIGQQKLLFAQHVEGSVP
jgi:hypothetical protein